MAQVLIPLAISTGLTLLANWLFPKPHVSDLSIPSSSYGTSIPWGWGKFRVTGNLIWGLPKKERKHGKGGPGGNYDYYGYFAVLLCRGPVSGYYRIWANGELVYNSTPGQTQNTQDASHSFGRYFRFYPGTTTQSPDPLIQAKQGADQTPAYRGFAYMVFENLPLTNFGNQLPSISVEIIQSNNQVPLSQILTDICTEAGLQTSEFDVSAVSSIMVDGFVIPKVDTARASIEKLQSAYAFDVIESDGIIKFVPQATSNYTLINSNDLGCYEYQNSAPPMFKETRAPLKELPYQIQITYYDEDINYDNGQTYARRTAIDAANRHIQTYDLNLITHLANASAICQRLLYLVLAQSITYEFFLPIDYLALDPSSVISVELRKGVTSQLMLTKKELGANYLLRFEAYNYDSTIYGYTPNLPSKSFTTQPDVNNPGVTTFLILDIPLAQDSDKDVGMYVVAAGTSPDWNGCTISVSTDGGSTYNIVETVSSASSFGTCSNALPAAPTNVMDNTNTLTVVLVAGELSSVATSQLDLGANKALVGNEVIQFATATLTATNTYNLTGLLRGRRGTEQLVGTHAAGDRFVLLDSNITRVQGNATDLGQSLMFVAMSGNQQIGDPDVVPQTVSYTGADLKPYAPVQPSCTGMPSHDITISWVRRDRHGGDSPLTNQPMTENTERESVDITNPSGTVVLTLTTNTNSVVFTAAQQIAALGALPSTITGNIYQVSAAVGRGYPCAFTLTPVIVYPIPTITKLDPPQGIIGTAVKVVGTGLTGTTAVSFYNNVAATFTVASDTEIDTAVPAGATTGQVTVTTPGGSATS